MSVKKRNIVIIVSVILAAAIIAVSVAVPLSLKNKNGEGGGDIELPTISLDGPKSIVSDAIGENASMYSTFKISSCYGLCNNYRFPVTATITQPDNTVVTTRKEFVAMSAGLYRVELSSQIGDESVKKTIEVNVGGYDAGYLFNCTGASLTGNNVNIQPVDSEGNSVNNIKTEYNVGSTFKLNPSGSVVKYKNVVDLNSVSGNLIELVPNVGTDWFELTKVKVRLTDAYDSSNSIALVYEINSGAMSSTSDALSANPTLSCSFIQVEFNGIKAANSNYTPVANTSIAFGQQFFAQHYPTDSFLPLHFKYDNSTNCVYLRIEPKSTEDFLVLDLDDPTDSYNDFKGFTTGEVYVSIESAGSAGSFTVTKIGNDVFSSVSEEEYKKDAGCLLSYGYDFENMLDGVVGYAYPLPKFVDSDVVAKLEYLDGADYTDITEQLANGFVPSKSGQYRISYTANNLYGYEKSISGIFVVNDNPNDIFENESVDLKADLMGVFEIPSISYKGGIGNLNVEYTLSIDGVESVVVPGQSVSFVKNGSTVKLFTEVYDEMNYRKQFEYEIAINNNVVKFELVDSFDKISLVKGSTFTVPGYVAIDYSKDDISQNNIDVVIKRGKTRTINVGDVIDISSDTTINYTIDGKTVKTISIKCVPQIIGLEEENSIDKQFGSISGVGSIAANDIGTGFVLSASGMSVDMPYSVSTSSLKISFSVFAQSSISSVKTIVTSLSGKSIVLELKNLGAKPVLWINGTETPYQISTLNDTYIEADTSGLYNKRYYNYTFVLDGAKGCLYNGEMVKLTNIATWSNKLAYDGFEKACAQVSFEVEGAVGDMFVLDTVSNQRFTTIHLENDEVMMPAIAFEKEMDSKVVKVGDTVSIPLAYAYDVLDSVADIRMSIYAPDGTVLVNNALPTEYSLAIQQYGTYSLVYTLSDSKYNSDRVRYSFVVQDNVPPTITLNGSYDGSYTVKKGVTVIGASVSDNNGDASSLVIWLEYSDLKQVVVSVGQHLSLEAGKYTIVYYAMDSDGNATIQKYQFEVKEGRK